MSSRANEPASSCEKRGVTTAQPASKSNDAASAAGRLLQQPLQLRLVEPLQQLAVDVDPGDAVASAAGGALLGLQLGVGGGVFLDVLLDKRDPLGAQPAGGLLAVAAPRGAVENDRGGV